MQGLFAVILPDFCQGLLGKRKFTSSTGLQTGEVENARKQHAKHQGNARDRAVCGRVHQAVAETGCGISMPIGTSSN
jgi:hypothetical protein